MKDRKFIWTYSSGILSFLCAMAGFIIALKLGFSDMASDFISEYFWLPQVFVYIISVLVFFLVFLLTHWLFSFCDGCAGDAFLQKDRGNRFFGVLASLFVIGWGLVWADMYPRMHALTGSPTEYWFQLLPPLYRGVGRCGDIVFILACGMAVSLA